MNITTTSYYSEQKSTYCLNIYPTFPQKVKNQFIKMHQNPSPRTGPQDLLNSNYDCEENQQKTIDKCAINQETQRESGPQDIESTNIVATL